MKGLILILLAATIFCEQDTPIPQVPDGLKLMGNGPVNGVKLHLEAFYDLMCPFSKKSFETLFPAFGKAGLDKEDGFLFTAHFFPLPYHPQAFIMSEGVHFIQENYGTKAAIQFSQLIFTNQETFGTQQTINQTRFEVQNEVAELVSGTFTNISKEEFVSGLSNSDENSRISWKYACSKGVSGTPTFFANGVILDSAGSMDANQFTAFVKKYLGKENHFLQ